jgi:hypothetical protein
MPVLMNLMISEPLLKMQTQATSAVLNFISGMTTDNDDDDDADAAAADKEAPIDAKELMKGYSGKLLEILVQLLRKGI